MTETDNCGVGLLLRLHRTVPHELACFIILPHGSDGCQVAFVASEYAFGDSGVWLNCVVVWLVVVYHPNMKTELRRDCTTTIMVT